MIDLMQKLACEKIQSNIYLCATILLIKLQISRDGSTEEKNPLSLLSNDCLSECAHTGCDCSSERLENEGIKIVLPGVFLFVSNISVVLTETSLIKSICWLL